MDKEKIFDLACNINDVEGKSQYPWKVKGGKEILLNEKSQKTVLRRSIQAFIHGHGIEIDSKRRIQAFSGSSDLPEITTNVWNATQDEPNHDIFWSEAFRSIQLKKGQLKWTVADVNSGSSFELIPEGGKIKVFGVAGSQVVVPIAKYGMGTGVTWEMMEGRELYLFWDQLMDTKAKLFTNWADAHYGLLATAGATNQITWQGSGTDNELNRDIKTLNLGIHTISEDNKDKSFGAPTAMKFKLYPDPILEERIEAAFKFSGGNQVTTTNTSAATVKKRNVSRFYSYNGAIPTNKALLVIPGGKIQNAVYMKDKSLSKVEIESLNEVRTYWTAYGALVGDNDQVYELAFA